MSGPAEGGAAPQLKRALSLPMLILYGLGTTVGAGIYALTGKIAGLAGAWTPAAFLVSSSIAAFTALSFAELSTRYPRSAGEAVYLEAGFGRRWIAQVGGALVVLSGVASSAALSQAALGYGQSLWTFPEWPVLALLVVGIAALATWGIAESVGAAAVLTVLEVGGVVLIVAFGTHFLGTAEPQAAASSVPPVAPSIPIAGILSGAVLGFYAFLGFEDMVNVAEEVRDPRRTMARAILWTLAVSTLLYAALSAVAVRVVPPQELAASGAPLTLLYARSGGAWPQLMSFIALAGMLNGVLIQIIMASRVLYGMSQQGSAPRWLGSIDARTQTPARAIWLVAAVVLALASGLALEGLARLTSLLTLVLFAGINAALARLQRRTPSPGFAVPHAIPIIGSAMCAAMVVREVWVRLVG